MRWQHSFSLFKFPRFRLLQIPYLQMRGEYFLNAKKQQLKGKTGLWVYLGQGRLLEHLV